VSFIEIVVPLSSLFLSLEDFRDEFCVAAGVPLEAPYLADTAAVLKDDFFRNICSQQELHQRRVLGENRMRRHSTLPP